MTFADLLSRFHARSRGLAVIAAFAVALLWGTLQARADVLDSLSGVNELIIAIEDGDRAKFARSLVNENRATIRDPLGVPAIILAVESRDVYFVEELLKAGARPDDTPTRRVGERDDERTALTRAVEIGENTMVRVLLAHGADPDLPGKQNETALIKAATLGRHDIVRSLLEAGADYEMTDMTGRTPLEIARRAGHRRVATILEDAGARY